MGRTEYDAYTLYGMLRDLNVNINECKNALKLSNNDVNQAAGPGVEGNLGESGVPPKAEIWQYL